MLARSRPDRMPQSIWLTSAASGPARSTEVMSIAGQIGLMHNNRIERDAQPAIMCAEVADAFKGASLGCR